VTFLLPLFLGIAIGGSTVLAVWFAVDIGHVSDWRRAHRLTALRSGKLPPATARQLRRAAREQRADLGTVQLRIIRPPSREDD
jgi:hypothetical protein